MVDQNSIFGGMLTTQGAAKKTNCDALGIPWEPSHMLIGDANGTDPVPSPSQTKLINQRYRAQINQLFVSPTDENILIAELVLPPDVGGWWIRELALEDKDGVFSAVANVAPSYKPLLAQGSGRNQVVRMHIITSGTSNIQLKIDPSVVLATRKYVDDSVKSALPADKQAGQFTRVKIDNRGVVLSGDNPDTLAAMGIKDTYTAAEIDELIAKATAMPVGTVVSFPLNKMPAGFVELDGSVKSSTVYPDLSAYLGTAFNKGNEGAGNFRLPDMRAEFLRGWDHGRGIDTGRAIGSAQLGTLVVFDSNYSGGASVDIARATAVEAQADTYKDSDYPNVGISYTTAGVTAGAYPSGGGVARPRNVAVMWCIKAWSTPVNQGVIDVGVLADEVRKATGRLIGTRRIRVTQVYNSTPGTNKIRVKGQGAGAAGGGAASTASGQVSAGCGGGAGAPFDTWIYNGFDGVMVTIGKGGTGVQVGPGNNGGATSFGSHVTAPGGIGGGLSANVVPPLYLGQTPNSQPAVGATIKNGSGKGGGGVIGPKTDFVVSGEGGASEMGPGGNSISTSSQGADAVNPGAGGGGAVALPSYPAHLRGGHGADGWVDVEEWT
ncbi:MAG: phage-related tail fiber protein-like protein [Pseudomonas sp.]|jgi:microcystin-dependent protein|nr:phage-related tail fiber protein-like protein [Pseudomonas sp.]MDF2796037.1 phage-related tail fiber protein-like protein [Pseudomonas orientalis]